MINHHTIRRNKWRLVYAAIFAAIALITTLPASARLPINPDMPVFEPKVCDINVSDLDLSKLFVGIEIEGNPNYDTILVFNVDGVAVIVTAKNNCVVGS